MIIILRNHIVILKIDIRLWRYWLISSLLFVFFSPLRLTPNPVIWSHLSFFFSLSSFQTLVKTQACFLWHLGLSQSMSEGTYPIFFFPRELLYAVCLLADLIRQYPRITQKTWVYSSSFPHPYFGPLLRLTAFFFLRWFS